MNPLTNVLTPKVRGILYAVLFVGALGFAAWQATDGDWVEFVGALVTALLGATAASNASWTPTGEDDALPNTDSIHGGTGVSGNTFSETNDYGYTN